MTHRFSEVKVGDFYVSPTMFVLVTGIVVKRDGWIEISYLKNNSPTLNYILGLLEYIFLVKLYSKVNLFQ
jgi:hypothetical protein